MKSYAEHLVDDCKERRKMDLKKYDILQATHELKCRHQIARNGYNYTMPCIIIGKTKSNKLKIIVFGDRNRKHCQNIKKIRYVFSWRVKEKV